VAFAASSPFLTRRMAEMTMRARHYVVLAMAVVSSFVYTRVASDWSDVAFYSGGAALIAVLVIFGLPWIELARDGSLRRRTGD
jgi:hypothetical protein